MKAELYARKVLSQKGWAIKSFEYEKPKSGFKCIEGGYFLELESDEDDWDLLERIPFDKNVFGSISGSGLLMALYKKDFIQLINKIPNKPSNI